MSHGNCAHEPPSRFFPSDGVGVEIARRICATCPQKEPCLEYALENRIEGFAHELQLELSFFQTNHEGEYVEELHRTSDYADGLILNPGAWTHYAWALRDALEIAALPAVEVHLSDVKAREGFRGHSVIAEVCVATVAGLGPDGYRDALERLKEAM